MRIKKGEKMKKAGKLMALLTAALMVVGMLAGCGKPDPDPNSGVYEAVTGQMMGMTVSVEEVYENGVSFDLQDGGKCVANLDGETFKIKWSTEGNKVHIEGQGVDLNGTIGGGDMTLENMMDMGLDMTFHCDKLLHADGAEGALSSEDEGSSGSVLARLKDAKSGKNIYGGSGSTVSEASSDTGFGEDSQTEGDSQSIANPDYKTINGDTYEIAGMSLLQPNGWNYFQEGDNSVRIMVGTTNKDDYMSKSSAVIEWHPNASGSLDTSNYAEPVSIDADFGNLHYKGISGSIPGGWFGAMMIAEHDDGYILVTITAPSDDTSIDVTSPEFSAILASVETK